MAFGNQARRAGIALAIFAGAAAIAILTGSQDSIASQAAGSDRGDVRSLSGRHLYLVPSTGEGDAAIDAAAARVIARYGTFSLVSADGSANELMRRAGADRRDDMRSVGAARGSLDPAAESGLDAAAGESLALVQFVGPIKDAWLARLRGTGATVITYMAQNAYLVYGQSTESASLAALARKDEAVRAVTPFTAADKTDPGVAGSGTAKVTVQTLAGSPGEAVRQSLASGKPLEGDYAYGATVTTSVAIDASRIAALGADPAVVSIEPWVTPKLLDERAAQIVAAKLTGGTSPTGPGYLAFLNGQGFPSTLQSFVVDITDEGIDKGVVPAPAGSHRDFYVNGNPAAASRIKYAQEATAADPDARDCGGHGTNVASIAAGYDTQTGPVFEDAQGFNYGLGISPRSRLGATKIFNCAGSFDVTTSIVALHSAAYASGARISNNSWGAAVGGAYTARSQEFDSIVRDAQPGVSGNQQFTEVVSAGNSGAGGNTIGAPGTAKNVITVGASESVRQIGATDGCGVPDTGANSAKDIIDFSSRGPTDDGRLKPDIVAPGTHVSGAQPQTGADFNGSGTCNPQFPAGSSTYTLVSGTSQAAPETTGFAALLREWYAREEGAGAAPSPALTKAIMVNTASDEAGGNDGAGGINANLPTQVQGWGRVNLRNVLNGTAREFVDQSSRLGATGQRNRRTYRVDSADKPLKVTLAFTDTPGPTSGNAFVNDLDLTVHAGGQSYKGNVFAGGQSATGGSADPRNNVENVFLPRGTTGRFTVDVTGTNIAGDGVPGNADTTDQDYALVVSNAAPSSGPVLVHHMTSTSEIGDGDGFFEPGERFNLSERLRNLGSASATGITSTLSSSTAGATVPVEDSTYPDIAANALGDNNTPFRVALSNSLACGAQVSLSLLVNTAQGNTRFPLSIPTGGGPGAPVHNNSTDVPKAIPDQGTVESILNIGSTAKISDLNVRVSQITHTFDGDLVISVIGPDGTTVLLSNRRGGSGFNFTDTVFDDEAATAISAGSAPFTGSFRPEQPLSVFDGQQAAGQWKLRISDEAGDDTGTLSGWGLTRRSPTCN